MTEPESNIESVETVGGAEPAEAEGTEPVEGMDAPDDTDAAAEEHAFAPLVAGDGLQGAGHSLELLQDVELGVTAELGRTRMLVRDILALTPGSVVELDRAAGSPVDVLVNGTLIARGEVVVIDEEFGIRVSEILGYGPENGRNGR